MTEREAPVAQGRPGFRLSRGSKIAGWTLLGGGLLALNFWRDPPSMEAPSQPSTQTAITPAAISLIPAQPVQATLPWERPQAPTPPPPPPPERPMGDAAAGKRMLSYSRPVASPAVATAPASTPAPGITAPAGTGVTYAGTQIAGKRAGAAIDTTLTLMPGVYGCTLDTAVNSERPGPFFCHTTRAIKSPDGVTLMEPGTRIVGNYQSNVSQGQGRIMSLTATAYTPRGVPVPLGAPVGDALGRIGMDGQVQSHLGARLGSAVLLMMTQGAFSVAQSMVQSGMSRGGGNTYFSMNSGGIEGAVAESLRSGNAIQNTVTKNQGEEIAFLVMEPISFQDAYALAPR